MKVEEYKMRILEGNYMKIPKMIMFDYGQTLIAEQKFDGVKGTEAVLQYATRNKYHLPAEQVQAKGNEINRKLGRWYPDKRHLFLPLLLSSYCYPP